MRNIGIITFAPLGKFQFSIGDARRMLSWNVCETRCADSVSILYWRCPYIADHLEARLRLYESFNSLLEMLVPVCPAMSIEIQSVSILYWRCLYALLSQGRIVEKVVFQFSIGDAGHVVDYYIRRTWRFNSLLEMHAGREVPGHGGRLHQVSILYWRCPEKSLNTFLYSFPYVSILYWRCRVSWSFGCVGF